MGGSRGSLPEAPPQRPQQRPSPPTGPPGQTRSAGKGVGREPQWRTDERGSSYRAPGWRGRGVAAFVPGDLLPLRGEAEGASELPRASRLGGAGGRCEVAVGLRPLPSLELNTKGRRRNAQSLPAEGGARPC